MEEARHILVENHDAYVFIKTSQKNMAGKVWYTSSPWLYEKILIDGEKVVSIDSYISHEQMNNIGLYCEESSKKICAYLDEFYNEWPYGIQVGYSLFLSIRRTIFVLFYKLFLLYSFINELSKTGNKVLIVGNCELSAINGFSINIGRFDTVYTSLARRMKLSENIGLIGYTEINREEKILKIKLLGQSNYERFLAILNLNMSLFIFKVWKSLFHFKDVKLPFKKEPICILFYKNCELLEEAFPYLFLKAGQIKKFQIQDIIHDQSKNNTNKISAPAINDIFHSCRVTCLPGGYDIHEAFRTISEIVANRINKSVQFGSKWVKGFIDLREKYFLENIRGKHSKTMPVIMVTNSLTSPIERALSFFMRRQKVRIFASEHGVTFGLSEMSKHFVEDQSSILTSDSALFYNKASHNIHNEESKCLNGIVSGAPHINKKVKFRSFQRVMTKRLINVPFNERVIVYVANLYSNNHIYNPGICNDYYYHNFKKTVVYDIMGRLNDHCLLKLYPTHRYPDDDPFLNLMKLPDNVKVIQYFEYRYLRAIGDVILCDSPQSTLGWVWSCRVPFLFLDLPSNPLLPKVAEAFDKAIFRVDCSKDGWIEDVKRLLLLPHKELLRRWKVKKPIRKKVEERYIFGPPGNAGKRAAKFIIEETRKWYGKNRLEVRG